MIEWLIAPWIYPFMRAAFTMIILLGLLGGMAGTIVVTQRTALQVESLAHALLPGLILAYLWMGRSTWSLMLGGVFAVILTRLLSFAFSLHQRTDHTTGSAIVIGFNFSLGLLLLSLYRNELPISLDHFILGDLLAVSATDNGFAAIVVMMLFILLILFYSPVKVFLFDASYAARRGWPHLFTRIVLEVVISIATILSFQAVGLVLTLALMIIPAATAQLIAKHLWQMFLLGGILGALEGITGLVIAYHMDLPSTPPIIMISVAVYTLLLLQQRLYSKI
ncbi:MAG: metal ABC transporter permease [SAR324 cluster bacterium]|nr:metal ABC transporter permease [SAR324 cluster bacterium]